MSGVSAATALIVGGLAITRSSVATQAMATPQLHALVERHAQQIESRTRRVYEFSRYLAESTGRELQLDALRADPALRAATETRLFERFGDVIRASGAMSAWLHVDPKLLDARLHVSLYVRNGKLERTEQYDVRATGHDRDEWFAEVMERGARHHWAGPYYWEAWDAQILSLSYPVRSGGQLIGVAGSEIFIDDVLRELGSVRIHDSGSLLLVNSRMELIYPAPTTAISRLDQLADGAYAEVAANLKQGRNERDLLTYSRAGQPRLLAYQRLSNGWILAADAAVDEVYAEHEQLKRQVLLVIAAGSVLALLIAYFSARVISRHISGLSSRVEAINAELAVELRQRQQAEQRLRQQNAELDAYARTVAHDLKTPLTTLIGLARLLGQSNETVPEGMRRQAIERLDWTASRMNQIVETLLSLSQHRLKPEVPMQPVQLAEVLAAVRQRLDESLQECGAQLAIDHGLPRVLGHGPWLEEVFSNLLSNAVKYAGAAPRIEIGGERSEGTVRLWVRDHGPGVPPAVRNLLFDEYTRFDSGGQEGHGLGLSIVRRLVEAMGGEVGYEAPDDGGARFWITLPAA